MISSSIATTNDTTNPTFYRGDLTTPVDDSMGQYFDFPRTFPSTREPIPNRPELDLSPTISESSDPGLKGSFLGPTKISLNYPKNTKISLNNPKKPNFSKKSKKHLPKSTNSIIKTYLDGELCSNSQNSLWDNVSRYSLLATILLGEFAIGWTWLGQCSTQSQSMIYYPGVSALGFRVLNEMFLYSYLLLAPLGCWLVDKKFSFSVFFGAATLALGAFGQYFSGNNFNMKLASNFIVSLGQITVFPSPGYIAGRYFPKR
jgi:hypothetical protein